MTSPSSGEHDLGGGAIYGPEGVSVSTYAKRILGIAFAVVVLGVALGVYVSVYLTRSPSAFSAT